MRLKLGTEGEYSIGLDLGTGSVGWALVDENGDLGHVKGKPTWGARTFPSADTAANTRLARSQRRRYARRAQRLECLRGIFAETMSLVDPDFFVRMRYAHLVADDRSKIVEAGLAGQPWMSPLFGDTDIEARYYAQYPTIWHLRLALMGKGAHPITDKADLRLVYLAFHNIVKYRGNFLYEDEGTGLSAANADAGRAARALSGALRDYADAYAEEANGEGEASAWACEPDVAGIKEALDERNLRRAERVDRLAAALHLGDKKVAKALAKACVGYGEVEFGDVFFGLEKGEGTKLSLGDEDKLEKLIDLCPDDARPVLEALRAAYSAFLLAGMLNGAESLSASMVRSYEQHGQDLADLKGVVRDYLGARAYNELFRGTKVGSGRFARYDMNSLSKGSYTAYVFGEKKCSHEDLMKNLKKRLAQVSGEVRVALEADERYLRIGRRIEAGEDDFLSKQKTRANGAIPYQLHLEEMDAIILSQGRFYPFLLEARDALERLVSSRIPYYVGPLNAAPDPDGPFPANSVDNGCRKFAWSVRRAGKEHAKAYPWNVDEVIDTDASAELFIRRMTGQCTYLFGEPVLPRHSLLYEEFCVLNELNGARWAKGANEDAHRFDYRDREDLVEEVFKERKSVSFRAVAEWLKRREGVADARISGTQAEGGFESKLASYDDFRKILGVRRLEGAECPLSISEIEEIILWGTVFEDLGIRRRKIEEKYGTRLTTEQVKAIARKRYTGWGRLSKRLLVEVCVPSALGSKSIMDVLREGDPVTGHHRRAMNLMEVLRDKDLGFQDEIDRINRERFADGRGLSVDDLPGSPALRRTVNQTMRVLEELVDIAGRPPKRICIEVTRDDDKKRRGTRTASRYRKLEEALHAFEADGKKIEPALWDELRARKGDLESKRLMLYFAQGGKSLYSGKPLNIERLEDYQVDHILPQSYIKDDSLDNLALVLSSENQRKLDSLLLDDAIVREQRGWWRELRRAGLISEKKYANLTRRTVEDGQLRGFINRQLVETSQVVKLVRLMCEQDYPETKVVSLRASLTHGLREVCGLPKCRELNDFHHAHDAYLACQMVRFIETRYPRWEDGFDLGMVRSHIKRLGEQRKGGTAGSGVLPGDAGFIVDSFFRPGFDCQTGEILCDTWDPNFEVTRIRRALGMKQCFLSRMPEEQAGAFWDETIYSPRDQKEGKNIPVALKRAGIEGVLEPEKYGGKKNVRYAYFFIFAAKDQRGHWEYFFEGVPIYLVKRIQADKRALREYACEIARKRGCGDARILRSKVLYRQKFELTDAKSGATSVLYLSGRSGTSNEVFPACQIAASLVEVDELRRVLRGERLSADDVGALWHGLASALAGTCPKLATQLSLDAFDFEAGKLSDEEVTKLVRGLAAIASGSKATIDLTALGGKGQAGHMRVDVSSNLQAIVWIDQSVTGIFERKTTFEELARGL